jgi:hypothetical protein
VLRPCTAHENEDDCLQDPTSCLWDTSINPDGNCRENKCNVDTAAKCNALLPCIWDIKVTPELCREDQCTPFNNLTTFNMMQECNSKDTCNLKDMPDNSTRCEERWCSGYAAEAECWSDRLCLWDNTIAPAACVDSYCGQTDDNDNCFASDRECEWDPTIINERSRSRSKPYDGVCLTKRCSYDITGCRCMGHNDCFWNQNQCREWQMYNMTNVDLHVYVDGSAGLSGFFSGHAVGYIGLMEKLRMFVENSPLTGQKAGVTSSSANPGYRMMFSQYGSRNGATQAPMLSSLSGDRKELMDGLHWHESNFQKFGGKPSICPSIKQVAATIETDMAATHNDRNKIVIVLAAMGTGDAKFCTAALETLDDMNVQVFGIGIMNSDESTLDTDTNNTIITIASNPPELHAWAATVENFIPNVFHFTDDWAIDPTFVPNVVITMANMDRHGSCQTYPDNRLMCMRNPFCDWKDGQVCKHSEGCSSIGCKMPVDARPYTSFTCENCQLLNGRVDCQYNFNFPSPTFKTDCNNARCTTLCSQGDCSGDIDCMWNATAGLCQRQVCLFSDQGDCIADFTCGWEIDQNPNKCRLNKCTGFDNYDTCLNEINITQTVCLWNAGAIDLPKCTENPCAVETFLDCENRPNQLCKWDYDMNPPQCRQKFCRYESEVECSEDQEHNCEWLSDTKQCREKPCQWDKEGCDLDARCATLRSYATGVETFACREANCVYDDENSCEFDRKCQWDTPTLNCKERWCTGLADETTCAKSNLCGWDITESPSICMPDNCTRYAKAELDCTAQECQWKGPTNFPSWTNPPYPAGGCVFKPCDVYTNSCNCSSDNRCFFETGTLTAPVKKCVFSSQVGCEPMDLAIIFGVAGGIYRAVGRRPNGYTAMWEMIRAWSDTAGLTGQSYADAPNADPGMRLGLIEFNSDNTSIMTSTTGAHGQFTGSIEELSDDIDYHLDNFVTPNATYVPMFAASLVAAKEMFATYSTNPARTKAVLFFADGMPGDYEDAKIAALDLKASGVELFTIQIDITVDAQISTAEYEVQQFLQDLATEPKDLHYVGAYLDNIPRIVLQGVCNPNAMVGRYLGRDDKLCPQIDTSVECNQRAACNWDESVVLACPNQGGCPNLNCIALLNSQLRAGYDCSDCMFVNGSVMCGDGIFNPIVSGGCVAHPCMMNCESASCAASDLECQYNSTFDTCFDKTCETKYLTQGSCDGDVRCTWDGFIGDGRCRENLCTIYNDIVSCNNHTEDCIWSEASSPAVCLEKKCTYNSAGTCDKDDRCLWYNETCIIRPCLWYTETGCINDPTYKCEWDTTVSPSFCRENNCTKYLEQADCGAHSECAWDDSEYYDECSGFTEELCDLYNSHCQFIGVTCRSLKSCREDFCSYITDSNVCTEKDRCNWVTGACVEDQCLKLNAERRCATNDDCMWYDNVSPGRCGLRPCAHLAAGACTTEPMCKDSGVTSPPCIPKTCTDVSSKCPCEEIPSCFWDVAELPAACVDSRFTACKKSMDVVFLLDGSDGMLEPMGRHSSPIVGITEFIRSYVSSAPLTKTPAGGAVSAADTGLRFGIVRAGDANMCGSTTNCQLSGVRAELELDLDFLAANIAGQPQMIIDAAYTKIQTMFTDPTRIRVVVIVTGTKAGYVNAAVPNSMSLKNITVVGGALNSKTTAIVSLQKLVKEPTSKYVQGVNIDDFNDRFLDKLCNAFDFFTPVLTSAAALAVDDITLPCNGLPRMLCDSYPHCSYADDKVGTCTADGCGAGRCRGE